MKTARFCMYCSNWRDTAGFKTVLHTQTGSKRGMCPVCQDLRKKPHAELVELAEKEKQLRNKR